MTQRTRQRARTLATVLAAVAVAAMSCASTDEAPPLHTVAAPAVTAAATDVATTEAAVTTETAVEVASVVLPDVRGLEVPQARRKLRDAGVTGFIDSGPSADATVTEQHPAPGTTVEPRADVTLDVQPDLVPESTVTDDPEDERTEEEPDEHQPTTVAPPAPDDPDPILAGIATSGWLEANGAVEVGAAGLVWVPWAPFGADADRELIAQRDRWDKTMPPLLDWVSNAIANGDPIAREKADKPGSWHPVVDRDQLEIHYVERGSEVQEEIQVCPNRLGANTPQTQKRMQEMLAPGGGMIHAVTDIGNAMAWLLAFSPGEPMSIAGLRFLADQGFVPDNWSVEALDVLVRRVAVAAVIEEVVPRAAMSTAPTSLWEACMDAASTAADSQRRTGSWGITLQSLWSRGLRLEHEAPPTERAWIEMIQAGERAGAIVCRPAETVHLVDASTGKRVGALEERGEAARALQLSWSGDRFRAARWESFEGHCEPGSDAWNAAVARLGTWADEGAATVDLSRWWALGIRQTWMRVGQWVNVPQEVAWEAHRSAGLDLRMWCEIGPPIRDPFDPDEIRDNVRPHCTAEQRTRMLDQVASAPAYTSAMSGFDMPLGTPWARRNEHPLRSKADILGCDPSESEIASDQRTRAIEPTLKRPWTPGLLAGSPASGWPRPAVPCPGVAWPEFGDERFWWPESTATGHGARTGG